MSHGAITAVTRQLRSLLANGLARDQTDQELLALFGRQRDEAAFAALVKRHGPMVLGTCRRVLRNEHAAEDAFQATFLVLARKAVTHPPVRHLSAWLHEVALRTAWKARALAARRELHEREAAAMQPTAALPTLETELSVALDEEIERLPAKYRLPVLLCHLQGQTSAEAARELGWPHGTVMGRLARARHVLRDRLVQRGHALTATGFTAALATESLAADVPPALLDGTTKSAVAYAAGQALAAGVVSANVLTLTEGVLRAMFVNRLRTTCMIGLAVLFLGVTTAMLTYPALRADEALQDATAAQKGPAATVAKPQLSEEEKKYIGDVVDVDPRDTMELVTGHSRLLVLNQAPKYLKLSEVPAMRAGTTNFSRGGGGFSGGNFPGGGFQGGGLSGAGSPFGQGSRGPGRPTGGAGGGDSGGGTGGGSAGGMAAGGDPFSSQRNAVATYHVVSDKEIALIGQRQGSTVLHLAFEDPSDKSKRKIISLLLRTSSPPDYVANPKTAVPTPKTPSSELYKQFVKQVVDPQKTLDLVIGVPRILVLQHEPKRVLASEERLVGYTFDVDSTKHLYLEGHRAGSTVLTLWFPDADDNTKEKVFTYLIRVMPGEGGDGTAPEGAGPGEAPVRRP